MAEQPGYPAHWEADVVLRDGATAHLRPIVPGDAEAVQRMHRAQSRESVYLRFFAVLPELPPRELERFTTVDFDDRVALVVTDGDQILGVGRYDRMTDGADADATSAEVAFMVADEHQGRGLGSILLEHLAAAARERGIRRFEAEVLPQNRTMIQVFVEAGYAVQRRFGDGVLSMSFDIDPTARSRQVSESREHRAEARSVQGLLHPRGIAVFGVGTGTAGYDTGLLVLDRLRGSGFDGRVWAVAPRAAVPAGVRAVADLADAEGPVDLVALTGPAREAGPAVDQAAAAGARGLVVFSRGFAESGAAGAAAQRELVSRARARGMRVIGPNSFGVIAGPGAMNLSLAPVAPPAGSVGLFSQSGALGATVLDAMTRRGLGVSSFVSAGNRADVSGNDLMQYWEEDPDTAVVCLYLESIGNPRKFARISRRLSRGTPVVVVVEAFAGRTAPPGHAVRTSTTPPTVLRAMLHQAGVIRAHNIHEMFDIAQLLAEQPRPAGERVAVVSNSPALAALLSGALRAAGLEPAGDPVVLDPDCDGAAYAAALRPVLLDPGADSVVVAIAPSPAGRDEGVAAAVAAAAHDTVRPDGSRPTLLACAAGRRAIAGAGATVPVYATPEDAVRALTAATRYARWRRRGPGTPVAPAHADGDAAREAAMDWLEEAGVADGVADGDRLALDAARTAELLARVGIEVIPAHRFDTPEQAVEIAERIGWPVALKSTDPRLGHRLDLGGVRLDVASADELVEDIGDMRRIQADWGGAPLEIQAMRPGGLACHVTTAEDPLFGPVLSVGVAGEVVELLGDVAHAIPPLTDREVADLVRAPRAAPLLFGHRGMPELDVAALEDLLARLSVLADAVPELARLDLHPVLVARQGVSVLSARAWLSPTRGRTDGARSTLGGALPEPGDAPR